jgi:ABC-type transport system, involved in lipoprotein release, permease component
LNLSLHIAKRYLFSKKSHNAINLISLIAVAGVAVATMAMVCTMSIFNGFQDMVGQMFSSFDPELKITPVKGKVFDLQAEEINQLRKMPEIEVLSETLEDNVLVRSNDRQVPAILKGVSDNYSNLTDMEGILLDGDFKLSDEVNDYGILGIGLAYQLGLNFGHIYPIEIYAPKRNAKVNLANPSSSFRQEYVYLGGIFSINQAAYDDNLILVPLPLAKLLFDYENEVTAIELKLRKDVNINKTRDRIQTLLGNGYKVKNRYEQQESSFKMMNIEKWISFLILSFILLIAVFNTIGSLSMMIIEKQQDVIILRNLGATDQLISRIFLFEGWMISIVGAIIGIITGLLLCFSQQHFGLLKMGSGNFIVNAYPVKISFTDSAFIFVTVLTLGFLATLYPVKNLTNKWLK